MSTIEIVEVPADVSKAGAAAVAAWKLGFGAGIDATKKDAEDTINEFREYEADRVRLRAILLRRACECIGAIHDSYSGDDASMLGAQHCAAEYIEAVFRDETARIMAEGGTED